MLSITWPICASTTYPSASLGCLPEAKENWKAEKMHPHSAYLIFLHATSLGNQCSKSCVYLRCSCCSSGDDISGFVGTIWMISAILITVCKICASFFFDFWIQIETSLSLKKLACLRLLPAYVMIKLKLKKLNLKTSTSRKKKEKKKRKQIAWENYPKNDFKKIR